MKKMGMTLAKTAVAAALSLQASAAAAPLDDLSAILEKQQEGGSSLLSETLGWEELKTARKEQGSRTSVSLEASEMLSLLMDLPDALSGTLGLQLDTAVDPQNSQWQLDGAVTQDGEEIGSLTLYGDSDMLSLEIPQLLSYPVGLHSGSFLEQYEDSIWEEMLGELELQEDIVLSFFSDEDSSSGSLDLVQEWKSILTDGSISAAEAMEVTTREDAEQPGVTLYDVTYDTESILEIYGDLLTATLETMQKIPGAETTDVEEFEEEWDEVIEKAEQTLGDAFTVTFSAEDDLLTGFSMSIPLTEEALEEDLDGDGEYSDDQAGTVEVLYTYTEPSQPRMGCELQILVSEEGNEEEAADIRLALTRTISETSEESTLSLAVKEGEESLYDGDIYYDSFDAQTGEWSCQFQFESEDETMGLLLNGAFSNVIPGESFDFTLDQAAFVYGSMEISLLSGSLSMSADPDAIGTPENVAWLGDMDEDSLTLMATEIAVNAESWMDEMGLLETEENGEYSSESGTES